MARRTGSRWSDTVARDPATTLEPPDFEHLLELRTGLRRFLRWSEEQARATGLTPAQHQLLLAVKGHRDPDGPTVGEVADYLFLRHHSAVGLIDRAVAAGLVERRRDPSSNSAVRVVLTPAGEGRLDLLAEAHLEELAHLAPTMRSLWRAIDGDGRAGNGRAADGRGGDGRAGVGGEQTGVGGGRAGVGDERIQV